MGAINAAAATSSDGSFRYSGNRKIPDAAGILFHEKNRDRSPPLERGRDWSVTPCEPAAVTGAFRRPSAAAGRIDAIRDASHRRDARVSFTIARREIRKASFEKKLRALTFERKLKFLNKICSISAVL